MNTIILMWNPSISSVNMHDYEQSMKNCKEEYFNWSVWDWEHAQACDRFYLVRVGEGNTGIVMKGVLSSEPFEAEDWSGKGRQVFYMDMEPDIIINPDKAPIITTAELQRDLPGFVWDSGHSGQILEPKLADMLEDKWHKYIDENEAMFEDPEKAVRPRRGKAFLQIITHPVSPRRDRR